MTGLQQRAQDVQQTLTLALALALTLIAGERHLPNISPVSPLYLPCISPISPLSQENVISNVMRGGGLLELGGIGLGLGLGLGYPNPKP